MIFCPDPVSGLDLVFRARSLDVTKQQWGHQLLRVERRVSSDVSLHVAVGVKLFVTQQGDESTSWLLEEWETSQQ